MISTFNYWTIVGPITMTCPILLAAFSVTEDGVKVKERGSEELWGKIMTLYGWFTWMLLMSLLAFESFFGIKEFWGRDAEGALLASFVTIIFAPALWGWLTYELFMFTRRHRLEYLEERCKYGLSKEDRRRRRRANQKKRNKAKAAKLRQKEMKKNNLRIVPSSTETRPATQIATRSTSSPKSTQRTINFRVEQRIRCYRIEERSNLNSTFLDAEGKHPISELLPAGVHKYYVAVNIKDKEENETFLGWENAEANLCRFVAELIEIEDMEKKRSEAVIG